MNGFRRWRIFQFSSHISCGRDKDIEIAVQPTRLGKERWSMMCEKWLVVQAGPALNWQQAIKIHEVEKWGYDQQHKYWKCCKNLLCGVNCIFFACCIMPYACISRGLLNSSTFSSLGGIPPRLQLAFPKVNNVTVQATDYTLDSWMEISGFWATAWVVRNECHVNSLWLDKKGWT